MKKLNFLQRKKQRGISLLEVMLSLSIIAIILVMATRYFFTASESQRVNQAKAQVTAVLAAATTYGHNQKTGFTSITTSGLVTDGYLNQNNPSISESSGTYTFNNPWHNAITFADATSGNASLQTKVDTKAACEGLASSFPGATCTAAASGDGYDFKLNVQQSNNAA